MFPRDGVVLCSQEMELCCVPKIWSCVVFPRDGVVLCSLEMELCCVP